MLVRFGISSTITMPAYRLELAITTYLPLPISEYKCVTRLRVKSKVMELLRSA